VTRSTVVEEREDAIWMLDNLDYQQPISVFIRGLSDPAVRVRQAAAIALAERQLPSWASPSLVRALEDNDPIVRSRVAQALGTTGDPGAEQSLLTCLCDPVPAVRASAAQAAGDLPGEQAAAAISALLEDQDPLVRRAARSALSVIGGDWGARARREYRRATGLHPPGVTA